MTPKEFSHKCKAACEANPTRDLADEFLAEGVTEQQLQEQLKEEHLLPDHFKINLWSYFRLARIARDKKD